MNNPDIAINGDRYLMELEADSNMMKALIEAIDVNAAKMVLAINEGTDKHKIMYFADQIREGIYNLKQLCGIKGTA